MRLIPSIVLSTAWLLISAADRVAAATDAHSFGMLTGVQAAALGSVAFDHQVRHFKHRGGYTLDPHPPEFDDRYYHFSVLGVWSKDQESVNLGGYAVNKLTGEVWDVFLDCHKVSFSALRKKQRDYLHKFGLAPRSAIPDPDRKPRLCY
jgi:hypothetical protein